MKFSKVIVGILHFNPLTSPKRFLSYLNPELTSLKANFPTLELILE